MAGRRSKRSLPQKAVYWEAAGTFDDDGEPEVSSAYANGDEIDVRWEVGQYRSVDSDGNVITLDVELVTENALVVGSIVWEGEKDDLPTSPADLYQVEEVGVVPSVRGRRTLYTARLMKRSNAFPTVAS